MPQHTIRRLLLRELRSLRREVQAYPDDEALWHAPAGISNTGGNLVLHLVANLQHFIGATLGGTGYLRQREAEFTEAGFSRDHLVQEIDAAARVVDETLAKLPAKRLDGPFPVKVAGQTLPTLDFLMHLVAHLGYHLGQIDYHRRITTGRGEAVGTVSVAEIAGAVE